MFAEINKADVTHTKGTILLIDDDDNAHSLLRYHLERAGFALLSAKEPPSALKLIEENPNLLAVLVDIHIPRPDVGWAFLAKLARLKQNELANTRIIVYSVDDDKIRARKSGADEHFIKPVNHKELISLIEGYAQQRSKADEQ